MKKLFKLGLFIIALCAISFNASALCVVAGDYRTADDGVSRVILTTKGDYTKQSVTVADKLSPVLITEETGTYQLFPGCFAKLTAASKDDDNDHDDKSDKSKSTFIAFSDFGRLKDGRPIANVGLSDKFTMVRAFRR